MARCLSLPVENTVQHDLHVKLLNYYVGLQAYKRGCEAQYLKPSNHSTDTMNGYFKTFITAAMVIAAWLPFTLSGPAAAVSYSGTLSHDNTVILNNFSPPNVLLPLGLLLLSPEERLRPFWVPLFLHLPPQPVLLLPMLRLSKFWPRL